MIGALLAGPGGVRIARLGGKWCNSEHTVGLVEKGEIRTLRGMGTSGSGSETGGSGGGLIALACIGGAKEGSPERVLGTISGRGDPCESDCQIVSTGTTTVASH